MSVVFLLFIDARRLSVSNIAFLFLRRLLVRIGARALRQPLTSLQASGRLCTTPPWEGLTKDERRSESHVLFSNINLGYNIAISALYFASFDLGQMVLNLLRQTEVYTALTHNDLCRVTRFRKKKRTHLEILPCSYFLLPSNLYIGNSNFD
jgi:hypothetical protein